MDALEIYIPRDRWTALAHGEALPNRTSGTALFAADCLDARAAYPVLGA